MLQEVNKVSIEINLDASGISKRSSDIQGEWLSPMHIGIYLCEQLTSLLNFSKSNGKR